MCANCKSDHVFQQQKCMSCSSGTDAAMMKSLVATIVIVVVIVIAVIGKVYFNRKKRVKKWTMVQRNVKKKQTLEEENDALFHKFNKPMGVKLKILLAYSQIIGAWDKELPVQFLEAQVISNKQISTFVNFDLSGMTWIRCAGFDGFIGGFVFATIFPIAATGILLCVYQVMKQVWGKSGLEKLTTLKDQMMTGLIILITLIYPSVSKKCIAFFQCDDDFFDGRTFLRSDYRIECWKSGHASMTPYASVMVVVSSLVIDMNFVENLPFTFIFLCTSCFQCTQLYPIGLPLLLLIMLVRANSKNELFQIDHSGRIPVTIRIGPEFPLPTVNGSRLMGVLYIGYEDECYYYEILDMMRRLLLTSGFTLMTFVDNDVSILLGVG